MRPQTLFSFFFVLSLSLSSSSIRGHEMDLASAHTNAKALILSLRDGVERLEKAEAVSFLKRWSSERSERKREKNSFTKSRCRVCSDDRRRRTTRRTFFLSSPPLLLLLLPRNRRTARRTLCSLPALSSLQRARNSTRKTQNKTPSLSLSLSLSHFKKREKKQTQRGAAATLARDLQQKLAALQKASATLDTAWRMAIVRQPPSARDLWKR